MSSLLSGLSGALALDIGILFVLVGARMWQCRAEYVNLLTARWERFDTLILIAGIFGFMGFAFWQRSRATYAWAVGQWRVTPVELQAAIYLPLAIVSMWAMLWWAYRRVLGRDKGSRCWRYMLLMTVAGGCLSAIITSNL